MEQKPHNYYEILIACVVMIAGGIVFPLSVLAQKNEASEMSATTSALFSLGLTEAQIRKLPHQKTLEEWTRELEPPEHKIDLRATPAQKPLKAVAMPPDAAVMDIKASPTKTKSGAASPLAVSLNAALANVDTGVAILDNGLNFLRASQTASSSWSHYGDSSAISDTVAVLDVFSMLGLASDTAATSGVAWLGSQFPDNTLQAAQKFWMLARSGQDVSYSFDAIVQRINDNDGGFGYDRKYRSDVSATAAMLETITASNYTGDGDNPDFIKISAILFLLNNQNSNGGWGEFIIDPSATRQTTAALGALFPYRNATLNSSNGTIVIKDYVSRGLDYLKNTQSADGTWNTDLVETALAYEILHRYDIPLANEDAAFQYLKAAQAADGSFGNQNPYATALSLKALSYRLLDKRPDLVITDITVSGTLVSRSSVSLTVTVKNIGNSAISKAQIYNVTANYNWRPQGYDLLPWGMTLAPGEQVNFTFPYYSTYQLLGDTEFKFYVEGERESNYDNNWKNKILMVASDPGGKPAHTVYFIAQKYDMYGSAALNVRWPKRDDPNLAAYEVMYRKQGTTPWNFVRVDKAWNGGFICCFDEGVTYEINVGVLYPDQTTVEYFTDFMTLVTMSGNPALYTGGASGKVTFNEKPFSYANTFAYGRFGASDQDGNIAYPAMPNGTSAAWASDPQYDPIATKFPVPMGATTSGIRIATRLADDTSPPRITDLEIQETYGSDVLYNYGTPVHLLLFANDDKGLHDADFWYFEPATSQWIYLQTATSSYGYIRTPWTIGPDLLGTGYKIRAIARDWKGNSSAPSEWGPFEIRRGVNIPPTIKITKPDSAGNRADATSTIAWDDSDPDSNAMISLYYDTDATGTDGTMITSGISEDSPVNSYVWDTSAVAAGNYYIYGVIDDGATKAVSYSTGSTTIAHATVLAPPGPPTNLFGISVHQTKTRLTWDAPLNTGDRPLTGYRIERKLPSEALFSVIVPDTATTTTVYVDTDLATSTLYEYGVRSLTSAGQSATTSNIVDVRTLDPDAGISSRIGTVKDVGLALHDGSRYILAAGSMFRSLGFQPDTFIFNISDGASIMLVSPDKKELQNSLGIPTTCEANRSVLMLAMLPNASIPQITVTPSGACSGI
ncbi:MAG: fibronectin type III domain-containing protein [Candidatus Sungbacteria bacterium]|uniref:Fibronectin type III domain-containing protein n=1 Tax=Candidatus Sungiibacteriota bacterium TaxID=2750080 RepID=A0A932VPL2_9BACT|nr:fibronectin type III domain-containing protein [Candidatus Sungbacteria bacterium]